MKYAILLAALLVTASAFAQFDLRDLRQLDSVTVQVVNDSTYQLTGYYTYSGGRMRTERTAAIDSTQTNRLAFNVVETFSRGISRAAIDYINRFQFLPVFQDVNAVFDTIGASGYFPQARAKWVGQFTGYYRLRQNGSNVGLYRINTNGVLQQVNAQGQTIGDPIETVRVYNPVWLGVPALLPSTQNLYRVSPELFKDINGEYEFEKLADL